MLSAAAEAAAALRRGALGRCRLLWAAVGCCGMLDGRPGAFWGVLGRIRAHGGRFWHRNPESGRRRRRKESQGPQTTCSCSGRGRYVVGQWRCRAAPIPQHVNPSSAIHHPQSSIWPSISDPIVARPPLSAPLSATSSLETAVRQTTWWIYRGPTPSPRTVRQLRLSASLASLGTRHHHA